MGVEEEGTIASDDEYVGFVHLDELALGEETSFFYLMRRFTIVFFGEGEAGPQEVVEEVEALLVGAEGEAFGGVGVEVFYEGG